MGGNWDEEDRREGRTGVRGPFGVCGGEETLSEGDEAKPVEIRVLLLVRTRFDTEFLLLARAG